MKKVLAALPNYSKFCREAKKLLVENGCQVVENETGGPLSFDQLKDYVHDIDAVIAGVEEWNAAVFDLAPQLKVIARFGVGVDNLDLDEAKKRGIVVTNCPGLNAVSVAEHTVMLMLNLLRECPQLNEDTRKGNWRRLLVTELNGKTVGLLGFGAVARNVAVRLKAFGCDVIAYDKFPNEAAAAEIGVRLCEMEEVLAMSDILSVHVPGMKETYHLICRESITKMKNGVYLVNTSRGTNVDEAAVCEALNCGKIAGFGTDVFEFEPVTPQDPLFRFQNYICTPHTAAESHENYHNTGIKTAQAVLAALTGEDTPWNRLV